MKIVFLSDVYWTRYSGNSILVWCLLDHAEWELYSCVMSTGLRGLGIVFLYDVCQTRQSRHFVPVWCLLVQAEGIVFLGYIYRTSQLSMMYTGPAYWELYCCLMSTGPGGIGIVSHIGICIPVWYLLDQPLWELHSCMMSTGPGAVDIVFLYDVYWTRRSENWIPVWHLLDQR